MAPRRPDHLLARVERAEAVQPADMVNHPPHYTHGEIECIDAIREQLGTTGFVAYLRGCIAKYNWRLLHKGNPVQDARKLVWYADKLEEELNRV